MEDTRHSPIKSIVNITERSLDFGNGIRDFWIRMCLFRSFYTCSRNL